MSAPRPAAWFSLDDDQRADAEIVAELEAMAASASAVFDFATASPMIAEADDLRETWDRPRVRFASFAEMSAELAALAALSAELRASLSDAADVGRYDVDALRELGERASTVGIALETLADDLEGAG